MYISKDVNIDIDNGYISEAWVPLQICRIRLRGNPSPRKYLF